MRKSYSNGGFGYLVVRLVTFPADSSKSSHLPESCLLDTHCRVKQCADIQDWGTREQNNIKFIFRNYSTEKELQPVTGKIEGTVADYEAQ